MCRLQYFMGRATMGECMGPFSANSDVMPDASRDNQSPVACSHSMSAMQTARALIICRECIMYIYYIH